jgi:hypothetical protein
MIGGHALGRRYILAFWQHYSIQNSKLEIKFSYGMVSGRLNVVKVLKRTNQIVGFGRSRYMIGL